MSAPQESRTPEDELKQLEGRIDELIKLTQHLSEENSMLRKHQESLVGERARLIEKNEEARSRVESMISRLKGMELGL